MRVDLVDVGVVAELGGDVDRVQHWSTILVGSGMFTGNRTLNPNGKPNVTGSMSLRNSFFPRLLSPSARARRLPRVRYSWFSCPPIDTTGTIGTPASIAVVT